MLIDKKSLKAKYDIVIVGAGIAGLTLARNLVINDKNKILLIEAGGLKYNYQTNKDSYAISKFLGNWPVKNYSSYFSRLRILGGNSHVWGGWCMELDDYDFANNEVWKYHEKELKKHYKKAYKILNIEKQEIEDSTLDFKELIPYSINIASGNFVKESLEDLIKNPKIDVVLNTKLSKINFDQSHVASIMVKNKNNDITNIELNKLVLSTGGIETTKILLDQLPSKFQSPSLGKYFMEHPQIQIGRLITKDKKFIKYINDFSPPTIKHLFDDKLELTSKKHFSGFRNKNSTSRNYFVLRTSNVYQSRSLYRLRHIILTRSLFSTGKIKFNDIWSLISDIVDMFLKKIQNVFNKHKSFSIVVHLEQFPHEGNSISFDENSNLVLKWQLKDSDIKNFKDTLNEITNIFNKRNESKIIIHKDFIGDDVSMVRYLSENLFGIGHHMGSTKMGLNKKTSVCDLDFKVHEISNLYLNTSSIFPTGGIANPTLTLLALSSMLAEKLNHE